MAVILWAMKWWKPLAIAAVFVAAGLVIWRYGDGRYEAGRQDVTRQVEAGNKKAREESREAAATIERLDDDAVRDRARERMRDGAGR